MSISENDLLRVKKKGNEYLLLHDGKYMFLIQRDSIVDEETYRKLLSLFPCEPAVLERMNLKPFIYKSDNLRSITLRIDDRGGEIALQTDKTLHKYRLCETVTKERADALFAPHTVTWELLPQWHGLDPALIRNIRWALTAFSVVCTLAFWFISVPYRLWSALCLLTALLPVFFVFLFPESFTLAESVSKKDFPFAKKVGRLSYASIIPLWIMALRSLEDFTYCGSFRTILLFSLPLSAWLIIQLYIKDRYLNKALWSKAILAVALTALTITTMMQMNHLFDFHPTESETVCVTEKNIHRGTKSTTYYCEVRRFDGEILRLQLRPRLYRALDVDQTANLIYHQGAFNAPYYTIDAPQE